jgi:acylphosphatase
MPRVHAIVEGIVQGVAFRAYTRQLARQLGLTGLVRNLYNGNVEVMAEGELPNLKTLCDWLQQGPPAAEVLNVKLDYSDTPQEFLDFRILHDYSE